MNKLVYFTLLLACLICISCKQKQESDKTDYVVTEKDLVPEGLAFDPATQTIYVSSTYKKR